LPFIKDRENSRDMTILKRRCNIVSVLFNRKHFDFVIPQEVEIAIDNLENAVLTNSTLLDCYLEELRAFVHFNTGGEDGLTEEQGEEIIDYYYRRRYQ